MTWKAQENTPANAARSHPLQLAVGRLRPRNTPRIQRKSNTIETCKPVSSHRLLLSNHLPVKVMASSKFKQMPKSKVSNAESNNWKNWLFYASRNEVQKCANVPTLQAFALNRYNDCTCGKLPLCAAWSKSDVTFEASQRDIYWNSAGSCRYSESLPASLHPSPAPMAPISTIQHLRLHLAIRDKTNNCAFLGGPCCMWPGAYRHLTWQMQLVSCNLHRSV